MKVLIIAAALSSCAQFAHMLCYVNCKRKMLDTINIALYLSESQSAAMFPNVKGEVDMNMLIVGDDPAFNEWCLDIFNHMWERATIGSVDKAKIV